MSFNTYNNKQQLTNGIWVFNKGNVEWGNEMNANMEALDNLLVKKTLTIKDSDGETLVEFNGSVDKELVLPEVEVPEVTIPTPKKLTIKDSDNNILVEYDSTADKELVLPEQSQQTAETEEIIPIYVCIDTNIQALPEDEDSFQTVYNNIAEENKKDIAKVTKEINQILSDPDKLAKIIYYTTNYYGYDSNTSYANAKFIQNIEKDNKTYAMFALNVPAQGNDYGIVLQTKLRQYITNSDTYGDVVTSIRFRANTYYSESYAFNNRLFIKLNYDSWHTTASPTSGEFYSISLESADKYFEKCTF